MTSLFLTSIPTAWGDVALIHNQHLIKFIHLPPYPTGLKKMYNVYSEKLIPMLDEIVDKVKCYFNGNKIDFNFELLDMSDVTRFQKKVYQTLNQLKYGETISYKELADKSGFPNASRAVGTAMALNPFPLIIPCHRVIRSDGIPGEFAYGKDYKVKLLDMEKNSSE